MRAKNPNILSYIKREQAACHDDLYGGVVEGDTKYQFVIIVNEQNM